MDKSVAGLIGAVTALTAAAPSHAATMAPLATDAVMQVSSYADLLKPIPNALALLKSSESAEATASLVAPDVENEATVQEVQYHHHHHHRYFRRRFHRHHHHHHHHHHHFSFHVLPDGPLSI